MYRKHGVSPASNVRLGLFIFGEHRAAIYNVAKVWWIGKSVHDLGGKMGFVAKNGAIFDALVVSSNLVSRYGDIMV